jgi:hypothetical protein
VNTISDNFRRAGMCLLVAGLVGLLGSDVIPPFAAAATQGAQPKIDRKLPGLKTGTLRIMTDTTAQIDSVSYPLAPGIVIENQSGSPMPLSTGWQRFLHYPVRVQYWLAGQTGIIQMIVYLPS